MLFFPYILTLYYIKQIDSMRRFSNRLQRTWKCGKNISDTRRCASCAFFCSFHILTSSVIYYWISQSNLAIFKLPSGVVRHKRVASNNVVKHALEAWRKFCVLCFSLIYALFYPLQTSFLKRGLMRRVYFPKFGC